MASVVRSSAISRSLRIRRTLQVVGERRGKSSGASEVPPAPTWESVKDEDLPKVTEANEALVDHLERLALVDFSNKEGIDRLNKAVRFADQLKLVDTEGVEPMDSVLEDRSLFLRDDEVGEGQHKKQLLKNATKTLEDYFVAPPGNIPMKKNTKYGMDTEDR